MLRLAQGAVVTPLAREAAEARGVRLVVRLMLLARVVGRVNAARRIEALDPHRLLVRARRAAPAATTSRSTRTAPWRASWWSRPAPPRRA